MHSKAGTKEKRKKVSLLGLVCRGSAIGVSVSALYFTHMFVCLFVYLQDVGTDYSRSCGVLLQRGL